MSEKYNFPWLGAAVPVTHGPEECPSRINESPSPLRISQPSSTQAGGPRSRPAALFPHPNPPHQHQLQQARARSWIGSSTLPSGHSPACGDAPASWARARANDQQPPPMGYWPDGRPRSCPAALAASSRLLRHDSPRCYRSSFSKLFRFNDCNEALSITNGRWPFHFSIAWCCRSWGVRLACSSCWAWASPWAR
jgi:hypothetical protein